MTIRDWTEPELLSAILFLLTGLLLLYASGQRARVGRRSAAIASILSVTGADYLLITSYTGETASAFERPGPIKRKAGGERGYFAFEQEGDGGSVAAAASGNGTGGGIVPASWSSAADEKALRALGHRFNDCAGCPDMVVIRPGYFRMGAAPDDAAATEDERPGRMIGFGAPFAIGRTEVTVGQYRAFATATGRSGPTCPEASHDDDPQLPVTCVSWRDAEAYASWLASKTGKPFRLPSEAEWEYAARAGATGAYATGEQLPRGAANIGRTDGLTVIVGSYAPNGFGAHDMHGNAAELVGGCWTASPATLPGDGKTLAPLSPCLGRALRDAHAGEAPTMTRLSARRRIAPDTRLPGVGFRLARDLK